jgi:hypothetical protein
MVHFAFAQKSTIVYKAHFTFKQQIIAKASGHSSELQRVYEFQHH